MGVKENIMNNEFEKNIENLPEAPFLPENAAAEGETAASENKTSDTEITAEAKESSDEKKGEYSCISFNFSGESEKSKPESAEITEESEKEAVIKKKKKKKGFVIKSVAIALACGIIFGAAFGLSNGIVKKYALSQVKIGTTQEGLNKAKNAQLPTSDVALIAQECMPSIVAITNRSVSDVMTFFGTYSQESTSSGSGIIIQQNESELLIVTNYHVIANSQELSVVFSPVEAALERDGEIDEKFIPSATVKGYDATRDLAVIAVKLEDIPESIFSEIKIATIGDSSVMKPGDQVIAIGNALGYGQSVTTGVISAVNRKITMKGADGYSTVTNTFIQTDTAINQGNSGGALLDINGHVIGINSVKIATTGVEGMGYAIPISEVGDIIESLMSQKTRSLADDDRQGYLGISGSDVTSTISQSYGIPMGVYVNSVEKGLAADKAGIKKGDVIVEFDKTAILSITQLQDRLRYYEKGETVKITVKSPKDSGYVEKVLEVTLSHRSDSEED